MAIFSEIVREKLYSTFLGDFSVKAEALGELIVTIADSDQSYFSLSVLNRDNVRLIIKITPEKYSADFVQTASNAPMEKKRTFCQLWENLGSKVLTVKINGQDLSPQEFLTYTKFWREFEIRFSKPFYDQDVDNRDEEIADYVVKCVALMLSLVSVQIVGYAEGKTIERTVTTHERNPVNRLICLQAKGYACEACGVVLEDVYGSVAKNFIEVHHSVPVASMGEDYIVKPLEDLHPLCPNCHAIAHRKNPPYSVVEIQQMLGKVEEPYSLYSPNIAADQAIEYINSEGSSK